LFEGVGDSIMNPRKRYAVTSGGRARMRKYFTAPANETNQMWKIFAAVTLAVLFLILLVPVTLGLIELVRWVL